MPKAIRPIRIEGQLAYITLTKGYEAVIDATDAAFVGQWNWFVTGRAKRLYAARWDGGLPDKRLVRLAREIMGAPDDLFVDHIDGDPMNNQRSNLRMATHSENMRNRRVHKNNTSGFKGVTWDGASGKWRATIRAGGGKMYLGRFATKEDAFAAYCAAANKLHGEFAKTR